MTFYNNIFLGTTSPQHNFVGRHYVRNLCPTGLVRSDRAVLQTLYRTRGEELLKNQQGWKDNSSDLDTWFGVALNGEERVVTLELGGTNRRFRVGKRDDLIYVRGNKPMPVSYFQIRPFPSHARESSGTRYCGPPHLHETDTFRN